MADSPDWTDANDSDPGITLLKLFAFLGISCLFGVWFLSIWVSRRKRRRPPD